MLPAFLVVLGADSCSSSALGTIIARHHAITINAAIINTVGFLPVQHGGRQGSRSYPVRYCHCTFALCCCIKAKGGRLRGYRTGTGTCTGG